MLLLPPSKTFYVAAPLAWAGITAVVLAMPHSPKSAPAAPSPPVEAAAFEERWDEPALKKQDRLPTTESSMPEESTPPPEPKPRPEPVTTPAATTTMQAVPHETKKRSAHEAVCRRGKVWRVTRHGWKTWRCRR